MNTYKTKNDYLGLAIKKLVFIYFLFILSFFIFRTGFVLYFGSEEIWLDNKVDILKAFYLGWKYDSLVASYLIFPVFIIFSFLALIKNLRLFNLFNRLSAFYFFLAFIFINLILTGDLGFFSFYQDHINIMFFGLIEDDTSALLKSIWDNYPLGGVIAGCLIYFFVIYKLISLIMKKATKTGSFFKDSFTVFFVLNILVTFLLFGGARGGYGKLVISPKYADFSEVEFVNLIALNGVVALEKAYQLRLERADLDFNMLEAMGYGKNVHKAFSDYLEFDVSPTKEERLIELIVRQTPKLEVVEKNPPHVVVFVMESFGASWMDYNSFDFDFMRGLDKHFKEDIYFKNIISSDNGTIGSLMTLSTNIPLRPGARHLSQSRYMRVPLDSSAHIPYVNAGYESTFIYGGKLGWRGIGQYYRHQKYQNIIGENAIKSELNIKGEHGTEWGIYDEHFFNYAYKKLENSEKPQFIMGLSTTNHPPFKTPTSYKSNNLIIPADLDKKILRERGLFLDRFKAFQYSNEMLSNFIEKIKNGPLQDKVIIAITGDHNFWGFKTYEKKESFSMHQVPFYIYTPKKYFEGEYNPDKLGSHKDVMTTLYNISLSNSNYVTFGDNLLIPAESYGFNGKVLAGEEGVILRGKNFKWANKPSIESTPTSEPFHKLETRYKSTLSVADYYLRLMLEKK